MLQSVPPIPLATHVTPFPLPAEYLQGNFTTGQFGIAAGDTITDKEHYLYLFIIPGGYVGKSVRYLSIGTSATPANNKGQWAIWGPVPVPVPGTSIIAPNTNSPVLLAKGADTAITSGNAFTTLDLGARQWLMAGVAYWIDLQFKPIASPNALSCEISLGRTNTAGATSQYSVTTATNGPNYATAFGTVGTTVITDWTFDPNWYTTNPVVKLY